MHPLLGVWAKVDWGDQGVEAYARRHGDLVGKADAPAIGTEVEYDAEDSAVVLRVTRVDEVPIDLGLMIADAVHSYRSALDHLIFELAFMDTDGREMERTGFPASDDPFNFRSSHVQDVLLGGLTKTHKAMLKRFQPYRGGNRAGQPHPVRLLHDLSNDDKHRLTQPTLISPQAFGVTILPHDLRDCVIDFSRESTVGSIVGRPFELNTEICRIPVVVIGPNPYVNMQIAMAFAIGLRNGVRPVEALQEIGEFVRNVVEFFVPEFERPRSLRQRDLPRYGRIRPIPPLESTLKTIAPIFPIVSTGH